MNYEKWVFNRCEKKIYRKKIYSRISKRRNKLSQMYVDIFVKFVTRKFSKYFSNCDLSMKRVQKCTCIRHIYILTQSLCSFLFMIFFLINLLQASVLCLNLTIFPEKFKRLTQLFRKSILAIFVYKQDLHQQ